MSKVEVDWEKAKDIQLEELCLENDQLKSQNAELIAALEFYADRKNWRYSGQDRFDCNIGHIDGEKVLTGKTVDFIGGKRARAVLSKIKKDSADG